MNETFKKLTEEIKAKISEQLQTKEAQDFIAQTKTADDTGSFEVVISTADIDRQGESIDQNGWDLDFYETNPIVLWAHDYYALPIGIADEIKVENGQLVARGRFASEQANPFAQQVRRLYDLKIVRATSVGFIAKEAKEGVITKAELLEFSFVPVPANPFALSLRKAQEMGFDTAMLAMKGINIKAEGDACTMDDGTEGMMKPDAEGNLVCMPKVEEKPETTEGEISEQINEDEKRKQKWEKLNRVWDIFDAFVGVYLDDVTPVEDFEKLLDEAIGLMKQATKNKAEGKIVDTLKNEKRIHILSKETPSQKGGAEEESAERQAQKQRSNSAGSDIESLNQWLQVRQVLRLVNNATSSALEKFNAQARKK